MKKQIFTLLITLSILLTITSNLLAIGGNMGGPTQNGSAETPYLIQDFNDFQVFCANSIYSATDTYTRLDCDLDLDPNLPGRQTYETAVVAPGLYGHFNGNNHVIRNMTINSQSTSNGYLGLFPACQFDSQIKDLSLENINISTGFNASMIGGLCGFNEQGNISNCCVSGAITINEVVNNVGGLCGAAGGNITNCHTSCHILCYPYAGYVGGLVGNNSGATISKCYATGNVFGSANNSYIGGLCGFNLGTISDCYSTGEVRDANPMGGLCGENQGSITNSYSNGKVRCLGVAPENGLCGKNTSQQITNCFWDIDTSTTTTSDGGTGKTTAQMKTVSTFLDAGWNLVTVWNIEDGQTYPLLRKYSALDTNYDNKINFTDFADFANNWLTSVE